MAHFTSQTEHGLHCLLVLAADPNQAPLSSADLAAFLGLSVSFIRKLLTKLEKAGLIAATEGRAGGFVLTRKPNEISVFDAVTALEGRKKLFDCKEIRRQCALFKPTLPRWVSSRPCEINAVFTRADHAMQEILKQENLEDLNKRVGQKSPARFKSQTVQWFTERKNI